MGSEMCIRDSVINYNLPDEIENYTHRSGRTARAGKHGESLVLINTRESRKIQIIEKKIRTTFIEGSIPSAKEICEIQLMKLIDNVVSTDVREDDIQEFLPLIMSEFESLSKEEIVKRFVSAEFNRFIEYYERAGDFNATAEKGREDKFGRGKGRDRGRGRDRDDSNKTRFFVNLGKKDGLNPGGLLRVACDSTGLKSSSFGRIDILSSYSFFEADNELADKILKEVNGSDFEGHTLNVEVTKGKSGGGGGRSGHRRSSNNPRPGGRSKGSRGRDRNRSRSRR